MKFFLFFLLAVSLVLPVSAQGINLGGDLTKKAARGAGYDVAGTSETTFSEILGGVVKGALSFVGVIFLGLMVYAGYLWMTARGQEDQIEKAQKIIRASVIGLIIAVGAYAITNLVVKEVVQRTASAGAEQQPAP